MGDRDKEWEFHLRSLSSASRDSNYATDPASDPSLLNSVKMLYQLCKSEKSEELVARVYPHLNKIFQRCVASISQTHTSNGLLLLSCGKVINCLDIGGESSALIAAGGSDPVLRIWDPRKLGTLSPIFQFSSHNSWISSCKWHHKSWFHLVSASYDGKVMLWDLRTAWPLTIMDSHKDKMLCSDWWKDDSVVSGGVDSKLCISSGISVL